MPKLNLGEIAGLYGFSTVSSVSVASVGGALWEYIGGKTDYPLIIGGTWLVVVGIPSLFASSSILLEKLGQRKTTTTTRISGGGLRAIPFTANGDTTTIFANSLSMLKPQKAIEAPPKLPDFYVVENFYIPGDSKPHTIKISQLSLNEFVFGGYGRQQNGEPAFARSYWLRRRRPPLEKELYYGIITLLTMHGLIINRRTGKSGHFFLSPTLTLKHLKYSYSLS